MFELQDVKRQLSVSFYIDTNFIDVTINYCIAFVLFSVLCKIENKIHVKKCFKGLLLFV